MAPTTVFMPDAQVFDTIEFTFDTIAQRLRESAYLTKGRPHPPHR